MYLTNCTPRALIGRFSAATEAEMKDKQALAFFAFSGSLALLAINLPVC